jgi:hypothetical protein
MFSESSCGSDPPELLQNSTRAAMVGRNTLQENFNLDRDASGDIHNA